MRSWAGEGPALCSPEEKHPGSAATLPAAPTCDWVLDEAQHRARGLVDVEAESIVFLWDLDDEVGVPVH